MNLTSYESSQQTLGLKRPVLNGHVNFPVCMAPMVGLSHVVLRRLVRSYLPQGAFTIWPTEMLNSRRLPHENLALTPETLRDEVEPGLVPQILGNEEEPIRLSVAKLQNWGAQAIDINMGCPVSKALKHNYGVALMGDPKYAREVVAMTTRFSRVPVSVKLRAGLQNDLAYLTDFVLGLQDAGAAWVCLHPRLAGEKRRGRACWEQIAELRSRVRIAVIGNGDVQTAEDALRMLRTTSCDMVMIGRALTARPWLLWQIGEDLGWPRPMGRVGFAPRSPEDEGAELGRCLDLVMQWMLEVFPQELGLRKFRFYVRNCSPWLLFGQELISRASRGQTWDEVIPRVREFFARPQEMSARTELRY